MPEPVHETVLIESLKSGSRQALQELYGRYATPVYRTALRITGSPQDAEGVLQDLFVGLPEAIRGFQGRGSFEGWIRRVAARMALMRVRRVGRRREMPIETAALDSMEPGGPSGHAARVDAVTLERALRKLPDMLRAQIQLRENDFGGVLDFERLENSEWITRRWELRMAWLFPIAWWERGRVDVLPSAVVLMHTGTVVAVAQQAADTSTVKR
jgi:RNA polymerase sigma factor (sigma-70 family)